MLTSELIEKTVYLLVNRPRSLTLQQIENDTALTVSWLEKFAKNGGETDAGVRRVETLFRYLGGTVTFGH